MKLVGWVKRVAIPWFTSLGLARRTVTLEVVGRTSGKPRRVSLSRTDYGGQQFFVSLAGESAWVRNVRAADGKAVILSRGRHPVRLEEIPREERAPIMLAYVQKRAFTHSGAQASRHFFGLGPNPTLAEMEALADRYIVMRILPDAEAAEARRAYEAVGFDSQQRIVIYRQDLDRHNPGSDLKTAGDDHE